MPGKLLSRHRHLCQTGTTFQHRVSPVPLVTDLSELPSYSRLHKPPFPRIETSSVLFEFDSLCLSFCLSLSYNLKSWQGGSTVGLRCICFEILGKICLTNIIWRRKWGKFSPTTFCSRLCFLHTPNFSTSIHSLGVSVVPSLLPPKFCHCCRVAYIWEV